MLTHLDSFKDNKRLKKTKKVLKHRFWAEIYQGRHSSMLPSFSWSQRKVRYCKIGAAPSRSFTGEASELGQPFALAACAEQHEG